MKTSKRTEPANLYEAFIAYLSFSNRPPEPIKAPAPALTAEQLDRLNKGIEEAIRQTTHTERKVES